MMSKPGEESRRGPSALLLACLCLVLAPASLLAAPRTSRGDERVGYASREPRQVLANVDAQNAQAFVLVDSHSPSASRICRAFVSQAQPADQRQVRWIFWPTGRTEGPPDCNPFDIGYD